MAASRVAACCATVVVVWAAVVAVGQLWGQGGIAREHRNSAGMTMIRIPPGSFQIGNDRTTDPTKLGRHPLFQDGDYDEKPVHEVRITHDFWISETEVTVEQFQKFRMEYQDMGRFSPYVTGVSWYEAVAFCDWLSMQEKKHYRLPAEAEWEYAARAGTATQFASGDAPPPEGAANQWGVRNMHSGAMEWTLDWYGPYAPEAQVDPVGPASGFARVVRGGGIMGPNGKGANGFALYYRRSANRASVAPVFSGLHPIGIRVVEGEVPKATPTPVETAFRLEFVKPASKESSSAPNPQKPWFRQRDLLPIPPEDVNAVQRLDGFIAAEAAYKRGTFTTKLFRFDGNRLELNINTGAAGYAQVGFPDESGKPIPGYPVDDCVYINGDFIGAPVEWLRTGKDVSMLSGKPVQLMFRMRSAKLFAMQFTKGPTGSKE